jgi:hypothetical protein
MKTRLQVQGIKIMAYPKASKISFSRGIFVQACPFIHWMVIPAHVALSPIVKNIFLG